MLPAEVAQLIGKTGETVTMEVEKGAIKKFADAIGDRNPLYWDKEYARKSEYGGLIAPPGFFGWPVSWTAVMPLASALRDECIDTISKAGFPRVLDGGIDYEFFHPVYAGDILKAESKIADVRERESKGGKMLFGILETSYTNQEGRLLAKERRTIIQR